MLYEVITRAVAVDRDAALRDAACGEIAACAGRAVERQRVVDGVAAGAVGMADDVDVGLGIAGQVLRELVQHRAQAGLDVGLADVEGDVARDLQLEPVVLRPRDLDAGALGLV